MNEIERGQDYNISGMLEGQLWGQTVNAMPWALYTRMYHEWLLELQMLFDDDMIMRSYNVTVKSNGTTP